MIPSEKTDSIFSRLFVLEMANNHMGDLEHGISIVRAFADVCKAFPFRFAFKLQYRDLDTYIHPAARGRTDVKYVQRFSETRLSMQQFDRLIAEIRACGFLAMATPFDEPSVAIVEQQGLDILKIASCSFTDWPLLERAVKVDKPIIASTAGASLDDIDRVVSFFIHRNKQFAIMHCVAEYPTPAERMQLSQIDFLRNRYPGVPIGFSTHEDPENTELVRLAIAKGATVFEKHVGLASSGYELNAYSASPEQVNAWLAAAQQTLKICGDSGERSPENPAEQAGLRSLRRGVFARKPLAAGKLLTAEDVYFAFPVGENQLTANDWSKYSAFSATSDIDADAGLSTSNIVSVDRRIKIREIVARARSLLVQGNIVVPGRAGLEISHHYGLDRFDEFGLVMITVVNRSYCKKLLINLPGQSHPEQHHKHKEETFHVLHGEVHLHLDGIPRIARPGDVIVIEPGVRHAFSSSTGAIIEEISSTHFVDDSYYTDESISANKNRKTLLTFWLN
jgi:sialic acid synthase SpsE/mannose-6-phosphate isomerase-like protein (cupin superfamily)